MDHEVRVAIDTAAAARDAASLLADVIRTAVDQRGRCTMAVSGGRSPWAMLDRLARDDLPWTAVSIWQVDERIAPADDPARNVVGIRHALGDHPVHLHPMPVEDLLGDGPGATTEDAGLVDAVSASYADDLPERFDIIHLGLGPDGHTASLVPGDPVLDVIDRPVAVTTRPYQGHRRMTFTFSGLSRTRQLLWLVTGDAKADALAGLLAGDSALPAGRVDAPASVIVTDRNPPPPFCSFDHNGGGVIDRTERVGRGSQRP
ncbi:MAG: 6-phosphogluconolactonase [Microthrixaceae bacterium]|nr:6-phosphogluconolactonase [Microthrixaceae bacterium]